MELYRKFRDGDHLTDEELVHLIGFIENALPFLGADPAFALVLREARSAHESLKGYVRERARRPVFGFLFDARTGERIRAATQSELRASALSEDSLPENPSGGTGIIEIEGRHCYVGGMV